MFCVVIALSINNNNFMKKKADWSRRRQHEKRREENSSVFMLFVCLFVLFLVMIFVIILLLRVFYDNDHHDIMRDEEDDDEKWFSYGLILCFYYDYLSCILSQFQFFFTSLDDIQDILKILHFVDYCLKIKTKPLDIEFNSLD